MKSNRFKDACPQNNSVVVFIYLFLVKCGDFFFFSKKRGDC